MVSLSMAMLQEARELSGYGVYGWMNWEEMGSVSWVIVFSTVMVYSSSSSSLLLEEEEVSRTMAGMAKYDVSEYNSTMDPRLMNGNGSCCCC